MSCCLGGSKAALQLLAAGSGAALSAASFAHLRFATTALQRSPNVIQIAWHSGRETTGTSLWASTTTPNATLNNVLDQCTAPGSAPQGPQAKQARTGMSRVSLGSAQQTGGSPVLVHVSSNSSAAHASTVGLPPAPPPPPPPAALQASRSMQPQAKLKRSRKRAASAVPHQPQPVMTAGLQGGAAAPCTSAPPPPPQPLQPSADQLHSQECGPASLHAPRPVTHAVTNAGNVLGQQDLSLRAANPLYIEAAPPSPSTPRQVTAVSQRSTAFAKGGASRPYSHLQAAQVQAAAQTTGLLEEQLVSLMQSLKAAQASTPSSGLLPSLSQRQSHSDDSSYFRSVRSWQEGEGEEEATLGQVVGAHSGYNAGHPQSRATQAPNLHQQPATRSTSRPSSMKPGAGAVAGQPAVSDGQVSASQLYQKAKADLVPSILRAAVARVKDTEAGIGSLQQGGMPWQRYAAALSSSAGRWAALQQDGPAGVETLDNISRSEPDQLAPQLSQSAQHCSSSTSGSPYMSALRKEWGRLRHQGTDQLQPGGGPAACHHQFPSTAFKKSPPVRSPSVS